MTLQTRRCARCRIEWRSLRDLEDLVVTRLAEESGRATWEEFLAFDDLLVSIGEDASQRLAFQASYPVHATC